MKTKYKNLNVIGSDETGVGDYLSPLVTCAVFVPFKNVTKLEAMGVTDSKKISDKKIKELAIKIKPFVKYRVKHLTQIGYNKLNTSFNANELKMFLHMGAINSLEEAITDVDLIIIDQFANNRSTQKYYQRLGTSSFNLKPFKAKLVLVEKGEMEHVAVAAGSILAREFLLGLMDQQNKKWKTIFPLGTNKIVESFARDFVKNNGEKSLSEVAKISFKTTLKVLGETND
ncbi:ribonuclease HIII [Candidatus Mycoplasma mahonii]|uniref:ribonuclease HIII n=1 Tax=Candidatus Mycoplasma mahonii TaxID=3004105 RepID=UPI0026EE7980|nr:ribonuclease HIII [Candidatus Mycoplasma mahonii]WKX02301.1 ribonuclease HIII [Candidatus Mycoplasma mahonii]